MILNLTIIRMKKSVIKAIVVVLSIIAISFSSLAPASAIPDDDRNSNSNSSESENSSNNTATYDSCRHFLGMVSWDCNTNLLGGQQINSDQLAQGIWMIAFNILSDISVIAAYLALGFVIYGGYNYIFSSGDPSKVITGRKVLVQAFAGLAIVMTASIILNTIRIVLGADFTQDCAKLHNCIAYEDAGVMVDSLINWIIGVAGFVAAAFIVYGGIAYITSSGEPNKTQKAKNIILYALIGLVIVALAKIITLFATNAIRQANGEETSYINITTTKELNEKQA